MAQAFLESEFIGYDFHAASVEVANRRASEHGLANRISFKEARAKAIKELGFDLVRRGHPLGSSMSWKHSKHVTAVPPRCQRLFDG